MPTLGCPPFCCFLLCTLLGRSVATRRVADSIACTLLRSAPALWFNDPPLWYILKCLLEPPPARTVIHCFVFLLFRSFVLFCVCLLFWSPHGKNHSLRFTERHWPDLPVSLWSLPVTTVCPSCSPVERYRGFFLLLVCYALFLFFPAQGFLFVLYGPPLWPYGPPNCRHYANSGPKDWQSTRCRPMVERTHWTAFTCWTNFGPCRL